MDSISSEQIKKHLYVSILCGGGGKRLWPRSRKKTPKQFIDLFGNETIFQKTMKRAEKVVTNDRIFMITNISYIDDILTQDPNVLLRNIIAEPKARDTALAMGMAALYIYHQDPEAVIANFASDHVISPDSSLRADILTAAQIAASSNRIVTIGIKPQYPHTGLGYIEADGKLDGFPAYQVVKFTEKPDLDTAKKFIATGKYYWNANLYVWKAKTALEAIEKHAPAVFSLLKKMEKAIGTPQESKVLHEVYESAPSISIDYAVSEKAKDLVLLPASFDWDDIGDWEVVYRRSPKDKEGNVVIKHGTNGGYVSLESKNNLIHFNNQLLALVGVENMIIVDTGDALLICHQQKAERVKKVVEKLQADGLIKYL